MIKEDLSLKELLSKYRYIGGTYLVTDDKNIIYNESDGYQSVENDIMMENDSIYRIASVSKIEVALCIMKLVEDGLINIYDDISKYIGFTLRNPFYPNDIITIEQVMTQTSSLSDGGDEYLGYDGVNGPLIDVSLKDLLTNKDYKYYTNKTFLNEKPGSTWHYSNLGCGILACIVEVVSGKYFIDYVKEFLLDPLNIDGGFNVEQVKNTSKVVSLYEFDESNKQFYLCRDYQMFMDKRYPKYKLGNNFRGAAGGLFLSAIDLSKISRMMINKGIFNGIRILKEETIDLMEEIHWEGYSPSPEYKKKGLQMVLLDGYTKETLKGHFGSAYGLKSFMLYNRHNSYIFLCNGGEYIQEEGRIANQEHDVLSHLTKKYDK